MDPNNPDDNNNINPEDLPTARVVNDNVQYLRDPMRTG